MIRALLTVSLLTVCYPATAQVFPTPQTETPRIQSATWQSGQAIVLTALPETFLTVMLEPGERIERAVLSGDRSWEVLISSERDSFQVKPQGNAPPSVLTVETDRRNYEFNLESGQSLMAAYLVRLEYGGPPLQAAPVQEETIAELDWTYRLRGDRSVRPVSIRDNGVKTVIEYGAEQALPAVFAIGATGDEQVVAGYMRGGKFVIDRVYEKLIFRIDKKKATARRSGREERRK